VKWAHTTDNSGGGGGGEGADNGDAGTNNCRGAASSSSNEKLVVAIRAGDERERLERMWGCVWMRSLKRGPREKTDNGDNVLTTFKAYAKLKGGVN
jgi:hypothetical protein